MSKFIEITDTKGDQYVIRLEDIHHLSRIYGKNSVNMVDKFIFSISAEEYERVKRELLNPPHDTPCWPVPSDIQMMKDMESYYASGGQESAPNDAKPPLVHIREERSFAMLCGWGVNARFVWADNLDVESDATCPECLELWRSRR